MSNDAKVREMLSKKFANRWTTPEENPQEIDIVAVVKELNELEGEIDKRNSYVQERITLLEQRLKDEWREQIQNAKNDFTSRLANEQYSKKFFRRYSLLAETDEKAGKAMDELPELEKRYRELERQKVTFETRNADLIDEERKRKLAEQIRQAGLAD